MVKKQGQSFVDAMKALGEIAGGDILWDIPHTWEIDGVTLRNTCCACPEQYNAFIDDTQVGYLRLRHGAFRVAVPDHTGETILELSPDGDGIFTDEERERHLKLAVDAILAHRRGDKV